MKTGRNLVLISDIIKNTNNTYEGDLVEYFKIIFHHAKNLTNPYHNFRHMFHVLWLCHDACCYYGSKINDRSKRNLLIAALFHDFDHSGKTGHDDLEIERAIRGLKKFILKVDEPFHDGIVQLIRSTEFPHTNNSDKLSLCEQILRDADVSQVLSSSWIQQILFGLSAEMLVTPGELLQMQEEFLTKNLHFATDWANTYLRPEIQIRLQEAKDLLSFLGKES